jgi:hypothetical protein
LQKRRIYNRLRITVKTAQIRKLKQASRIVRDNNCSRVQRSTHMRLFFLYSIQDFLRWWYIKMPIWHLRKLNRLSTVVDDNLSLSILLRTFFIPWHRDYSVMGILFGIVMRILYLPIATAIYLVIITFYIFVILLWLFLPIATLTFIISSLIK